MNQNFGLDLRAARRKSGLSQADLGYLLGGGVRVLRQLEDGKRAPSLTEICTLSLILGRSFESFFAELLDLIRADLAERLATLPKPRQKHASTLNRKTTLDRLATRLSEERSGDEVW